LLRRAGGVPFFLVSCAQAVRLQDQENGGAPAASLPGVPWEVAQGLRQRIAGLPQEAQDLLGVAAVAGRQVEYALLAAVAAGPEAGVARALEAACRAHLLEEAGDEGYQFAHDVIREVVEADLGTARRRALHRQIAQLLAEGEGTLPVEAVAYHFAHGGDHAQAAEWLERAGDEARASFANVAACEHFMAARAHLQSRGAAAGALARLDEKLGDLHTLLGEYAQAQAEFARAREQATDPIRRAELWHKEGVTWQRRGEIGQALAAFDAAEAEAGSEQGEGSLSRELRATLEVSRSDIAYDERNHARAEEGARRALALLGAGSTGRAADRARARAAYLLGETAVLRGDLDTGETWYRHSLAVLERCGDQEGIAFAWTNLGYLAFRRGDAGEAEACYRRSLAVSERSEDRLGIGYSWNCLGTQAWTQGESAAAEEYARRGLAIAQRLGHPALVGWSWINLTAAALLRGDLAGAEACARESLAVAERFRTVHALTETWVLQGAIACERGDLPAAARWYRRVRALGRPAGLYDTVMEATLGQVRVQVRAASTRCEAPRPRVRAYVAALLEQASALRNKGVMAWYFVQARLLAAEWHLRLGEASAAQALAEEALQLAARYQTAREEALAHRVLAQCAGARGLAIEAEARLRTALALLSERGIALEAARTALLLAETLAAGRDNGTVPDEARTLLTEAQAQFASSGAALDLERARQLHAVWGGL
jgi:tetratricopeptide (TPR) repeat protein